MSHEVWKSSLSPARRRFVELLQQLNFGRVEKLQVRNGEPSFDPPPGVIYEVKFGGDNGTRPERAADDFLLKAQVVELLAHLERLGDGTVALIEVKYGLPFKMEVAGAVR